MSKQIHFFRKIEQPDRFIVMYNRPDQDWHHRFNRTGRYGDGTPYGYPAISVVYEGAVDCEERTHWALCEYLTHEAPEDTAMGRWAWYIITDLEAVKQWVRDTDERLHREAEAWRLREMEGSQISLF